MYLLKKYFSFLRMYGWQRCLVKYGGRNRQNNSWISRLLVNGPLKNANTAIIGCGQFAFSTICYFLHKEKGNIFVSAYDVNTNAQQTLSTFWKFSKSIAEPAEIFDDHKVKFIYIASNHASHMTYAKASLEAGKYVHIEKPLVTHWDDFQILQSMVAKYSDKMASGYNRPFSSCLSEFKKHMQTNEKLHIQAHVWAHAIKEDHWYRLPGEGTRICGNAGHWIDLAIHLWQVKNSLGRKFELSLIPGDQHNADDNFTLTIRNENMELFSLSLFSMQEPLDGIQEQIFLHQNSITAYIDDFQKLEVQQGQKQWSFSPQHKDVGHQACILQLHHAIIRPWDEVLISTQLILHFTDMVRRGEHYMSVEI